jgi:hypothetical protein
VVPEADVPSLRTRIPDPRVQVIAEEAVVPELQRTGPWRFTHHDPSGGSPDRERWCIFTPDGPTFALNGWYLQQLIKLSMARIVATPFYLTLDADVVCVRKIAYEDLVRDGRAIAYVSDAVPAYPAGWYLWAEELLGFSRSGQWHGITPAVLSVDAVHRLLSFLQARCGPDTRAESYLLSHTPWTEYTLYFTYLEHEGLFAAFHTPVPVEPYGNNIWRPAELAAWDPADSFSSDHAFSFSVLQSRIVPDVDEIVSRIDAYFREIGQPSPFAYTLDQVARRFVCWEPQ